MDTGIELALLKLQNSAKTIPFDKTQWIEHLNVTMVMTTMNMRITMIMEMVTTFVVANGMTFANTAFELSAS